jgi:hypothetical protein
MARSTGENPEGNTLSGGRGCIAAAAVGVDRFCSATGRWIEEGEAVRLMSSDTETVLIIMAVDEDEVGEVGVREGE